MIGTLFKLVRLSNSWDVFAMLCHYFDVLLMIVFDLIGRFEHFFCKFGKAFSNVMFKCQHHHSYEKVGKFYML